MFTFQSTSELRGYRALLGIFMLQLLSSDTGHVKSSCTVLEPSAKIEIIQVIIRVTCCFRSFPISIRNHSVVLLDAL